MRLFIGSQASPRAPLRRAVRRPAMPLCAALLVACVAQPPRGAALGAADSGRLVTTVAGFSGPESVRYDAGQDVYFVGNFNGDANARDDNGFISRMRPDGTIEALRFIEGGKRGVTLHAPRGLTIVGDTLWAVDVDAVRGFDRRSGAPVASIPFDSAAVGFLNDVAAGPDGALYVTDTGKNRIYRIAGRTPSVAVADTALGAPNGITWDSAGGRFVVVPFGGAHDIRAWRPGGAMLVRVGTSAGGRFDGVEPLGGERLLVASQADSSLQLFVDGSGRPIARLVGAPADIGVDTRRHRVAVPYVALNRVDLYQLPRY